MTFSPTAPSTKPLKRMQLRFLPAVMLAVVFAGELQAQEAQWIWSPVHQADEVPHGACYFRKTVNIRSPEQGQVSVLADDSYELFVNGRRVGSGQSSEKFRDHDISNYISSGRNVIAAKVTNSKGSTAGIAARVMIKPSRGDWQTFSTDHSWRTNLRPLPFWNTLIYNDGRWSRAAELGTLGETAPWDVREEVAAEEGGGDSTARFRVAEDFVVEQVIDGEQTGSLIAIAFNEFGHLLAAREGGALTLIFDQNEDGRLDTVRDYGPHVKNCQGILALNGDVYVTADGPKGAALYRLSDANQDGRLESIKMLIRFGESMIEHGPHGLALGPDGLIYAVVGNQGTAELQFDSSSPLGHVYEGDLMQPRYEDPHGHAVGVKAPGGIVLRTDLDGSSVELFAGGFRNPYDLAFDQEGELFVHDSDTESDIGTGWYRPNRLYHVIPGAELGWRSGWAKFPDYFVDTLPGVLDTGRGSPTGSVFYKHFAYPTKYHGALFLGDWSEGRILAVKPKRSGATFTAASEVFLEGRPLNVTDLAVGPDGALYFSTGGRGTEGGIYRISWTGKVPSVVSELGEGISRVIRQPQPDAAWSRQEIARVQATEGSAWGKQLRGVARSTANPWYYRTRALELMQLFGPSPSPELLIRLSKDGNEIVRAKAAELMGLHADDQTHYRLLALLEDPDRVVRRRTCEALAQAGQPVSVDALTTSLLSDDLHEAWSARRLLQTLPIEQWRETVLTTEEHRLFIQGSLALVIQDPTEENSLAVAGRFYELLEEFVTDRDFIDMLRLLQVALHRADVPPDELAVLSEALGEEFPSGDKKMNRELARLLTYLQVAAPMERYLEFLSSDVSREEKLHLALHLRFLKKGWTLERRLQLLDFYKAVRKLDGGGSLSEYVSRVERDFGRAMPLEEGLSVLMRGTEWPDAATGVLYNLPAELDEETRQALVQLDQRLPENPRSATKPLRAGILAVLARSGHAQSTDYLRRVWDTEPERREVVALGLAQEPDGTNWDYLIRSLPILRGDAAVEVLRQLKSVNLAPDGPEAYRQVILRGLELKDERAESALELLDHWTEHQVSVPSGWSAGLRAWQKWYSAEYPEALSPTLPVALEQARWKFEELYEHLTSESGASGSARNGAVVFTKVQCDKCHRIGNRGELLGPDLTGLSKRFMMKEVLESIVYPSHVISDQFSTRTVVKSDGRTFTGIVSSRGSQSNLIVLDSNGDKHMIPESEVDEVLASRQSVMPAGLLDSLTLVEISDLFAYLGMLPPATMASRPAGNTTR